MNRARSAITFLVAVAELAFAQPAAAQQLTTPSPFHTGQWALEGYATGQTGGVLRFITPRTAIVFDVSGNRSTSEPGGGALITVGDVIKTTDDAFDASLGLRRHVMVAPRIAVTYGLGALAGTMRHKVEYALQDKSVFSESFFGGYVDGGGQAMLTDHFAVGLAYRFRIQRTINNVLDQSGTSMRVSFLPIRAALYF